MDVTVPQDEVGPVRLRVMGKGRKERTAYLERDLAVPLLRYLAKHDGKPPNQPLFRNRLDKPISVAGVQYWVRRYANSSGVTATCHRLRHTYARWMAEGEVPVLALSRLMGHAQLQSTQRYIDGADPHVRRAYETAMGKLASSSPTTVDSAPVSSSFSPDTGVVTITRPEPPPFDGSQWQLDWPDWLRQGCLVWLQHQWWQWKPSQRQHHAKVRRSQWKIFWNWQLAQRSIQGWSDLRPADLTAFVDAQFARGLKAKSVRSILDGVYAVLLYLEEQGQLSTVPPCPKIALPKPLPRHLSPHELLDLEAHLRQQQAGATSSTWLDLALYSVLAHAGLRISEALDLRIQDLNLPARQIRIRQGKGRRDRVVYLTETAVSIMESYLTTVPHAPGDLVFSWQPRGSRHPLSYQQALKRIRQLGEAAGIQKVSPIKLRHTYATTLLNNGVSLNVLRRLMGHEHFSTTLIYARLADKTVELQYQSAMKRVINP